MGVFYSLDPEHMRLSELEFVVEREYLGENLGRFLLRGQAPPEFARLLFGATSDNPNSRLMQNPELGITDADSLAAAIQQLIDWKALILVAAWPEVAGQLFNAQGQLMQSIPFPGCVFRLIPDADSDGKRTLVPIDSGRWFRGIAAACSDALRTPFPFGTGR